MICRIKSGSSCCRVQQTRPDQKKPCFAISRFLAIPAMLIDLPMTLLGSDYPTGFINSRRARLKLPHVHLLSYGSSGTLHPFFRKGLRENCIKKIAKISHNLPYVLNHRHSSASSPVMQIPTDSRSLLSFRVT